MPEKVRKTDFKKNTSTDPETGRKKTSGHFHEHRSKSGRQGRSERSFFQDVLHITTSRLTARRGRFLNEGGVPWKRRNRMARKLNLKHGPK